MPIRLSAGLQKNVLGYYGVTAMMDRGVIDVYSGQQPITADEAVSGTHLGRITTEGGTFIPGSSSSAALRVAYDSTVGGLTTNGVWRLVGSDTGVAGWWRFKWNYADDDAYSVYYPRIDGAVGESLVLANKNITPSTNTVITEFLLAFSGA